MRLSVDAIPEPCLPPTDFPRSPAPTSVAGTPIIPTPGKSEGHVNADTYCHITLMVEKSEVEPRLALSFFEDL